MQFDHSSKRSVQHLFYFRSSLKSNARLDQINIFICRSARGFMHMRIQKNEELNAYILGQFSKPFDSIPEMVRHFSVNRLPIRGAEHMCLLHPVIAQLL